MNTALVNTTTSPIVVVTSSEKSTAVVNDIRKVGSYNSSARSAWSNLMSEAVAKQLINNNRE